MRKRRTEQITAWRIDKKIILNEIPIILVNIMVEYHVTQSSPCEHRERNITFFLIQYIQITYSYLSLSISKHDMILPCKYTLRLNDWAFTWCNNAYDLWMLFAAWAYTVRRRNKIQPNRWTIEITKSLMWSLRLVEKRQQTK